MPGSYQQSIVVNMVLASIKMPYKLGRVLKPL